MHHNWVQILKQYRWVQIIMDKENVIKKEKLHKMTNIVNLL